MSEDFSHGHEIAGNHSTSRTIPGPHGIPLYVETYGDPAAKQVIVFIHGGLQSLRCWRQQYPVFSKQAYVIGFDLPWHGESNPVPPEMQVTPDLWGDSVRMVLSSLDLLERPHAVAFWSFGGLVMRNYLLRYGPGQIKGLISVGSALAGMVYGMQLTGIDTPSLQVMGKVVNVNVPFQDRMQAVELFINMLTHHQPDLAEYYYTYGYTVKSFLASAHLGVTIMADSPGDGADFLRSLQIPTLLIQGKNDVLVAPIVAQHMVQVLPQATLLEYEECGHSSFLEYPERFNQDVQVFLDTIWKE